MSDFFFTEKFSVSVPNIEEDIKQIYPVSNNALIIEIAAIHEGISRNKVLYTREELEKSIPSWTVPFPKPIIWSHDRHAKPFGRVMSAKMAEEFDGTPYIALQAAITDNSAIDRILDGRFLTGSVSGSAKVAECSICGKPFRSRRGKECKHVIGEVYKGKEAVMVIREIEWAEFSFVNVPGDVRSRIYAIKSRESVNPVEPVEDYDIEADSTAHLYMLNLEKAEAFDMSNGENLFSKSTRSKAQSAYLGLKGKYLATSAVAVDLSQDSFELAESFDDIDTEPVLCESGLIMPQSAAVIAKAGLESFFKTGLGPDDGLKDISIKIANEEPLSNEEAREVYTFFSSNSEWRKTFSDFASKESLSETDITWLMLGGDESVMALAKLINEWKEKRVNENKQNIAYRVIPFTTSVGNTTSASHNQITYSNEANTSIDLRAREMADNNKEETVEEQLTEALDALINSFKDEDNAVVESGDEHADETIEEELPENEEKIEEGDSTEADEQIEESSTDTETEESVDEATDVEESTTEEVSEETELTAEEAAVDSDKVEEQDETNVEEESQDSNVEEDSSVTELVEEESGDERPEEDAASRIKFLEEQNEKLLGILKHMLAEQVVSYKVRLGTVKREDYSTAVAEHATRSLHSLVDAKKDFEQIAEHMPNDTATVPAVESTVEVVSDGGDFVAESETDPHEESVEKKVEDKLVNVLMGRLKINHFPS